MNTARLPSEESRMVPLIRNPKPKPPFEPDCSRCWRSEVAPRRARGTGVECGHLASGTSASFYSIRQRRCVTGQPTTAPAAYPVPARGNLGCLGPERSWMSCSKCKQARGLQSTVIRAPGCRPGNHPREAWPGTDGTGCFGNCCPIGFRSHRSAIVAKSTTDQRLWHLTARRQQRDRYAQPLPH